MSVARLALALALLVPSVALSAERVASVNLLEQQFKDDKVVVRTHSDVAGTIAGTTVDLVDPDTGKAIESVSLTTPSNTIAVLAGGLAKAGDAVTFSFELSKLKEDGTPSDDVVSDTVSVEAISTEKTKVKGSGGYTYIFWIRPNGSVRARITNDNDGWRGGGIGGAKVVVGKESAELAVDRIVDVWRSTLKTDLPDVDRFELVTKAVDAKGTTLATQQETVFTEPATAPPTVMLERARETSRGQAKALISTRHDGTDVSALEVELTDASTGKVVLDTVLKAPDAIDRSYAEVIEFEDRPDGETYLVLIDLLDASGKPVGDQLEVELTAPETVTGEITAQGVYITDSETANLTLWNHPDLGYMVAVEYDGADVGTVASVDLTFEEPFEGPPPLESTINLPLVVERAHWSVTGTTTLPDDYAITARPLDAEGSPLSAVQSGGSDPGVTYKNNEPKPKKTDKKRDCGGHTPCPRPPLERIVIMKPLDCLTCSS